VVNGIKWELERENVVVMGMGGNENGMISWDWE